MIRAIASGFRYIMAVAGAVGLLYTLSYPDSILPPTPDVAYAEGFTLYDVKGGLWVLPLLVMEAAVLCGPHRNRVWFTAQLGVLTAALWAYPVLSAEVPEWVRPTMSFEDGKLRMGLLFYCLILSGSLVLRGMVLPVLVHTDLPDTASGGSSVGAFRLDPAKAKTVQQIAAAPVRPRVHFRFEAPDGGIIRSFLRFMVEVGQKTRRRRIAVWCGIGLTVLWFFLYPQPDAHRALARDLAAMYGCRRSTDGTGRTGTHRAVHAAYRVFKYISDHESLAGMSVHRAEEWLQLWRAPEAYRAVLRDDSDLTVASVDPMYDTRTRFMTVRSGRRIAVLYVRMNPAGDRITVSEVADAGWNDAADQMRRIFGRNLRSETSFQ